MQLSDFWRDRRVFITGHSGFKGTWLALWLGQLGAVVTGYSLPEDNLAMSARRRAVGAGLKSIFGDVCDYSRLKEALIEANPEIIFHLAAQSLVRFSYREPRRTYAVNVMGTAYLLDAARSLHALRSLVIVTTDKCYEDQAWIWGYRENDRLGGRDPYSSSKACAEMLTSSWRESFFSAADAPAIITARAGNVIGGGDWAEDRLVPDMVRALTSGTCLQIRNPRAVRPWQHVLDPLSGYLRLARLSFNEKSLEGAWNFGPTDAGDRHVGCLVDTFINLWGKNCKWTHYDGPHPHETPTLRLDSSKAVRQLGWRPILDGNTALAWTAEWYRRHANGEDPVGLTLGQIAEYLDLLDSCP